MLLIYRSIPRLDGRLVRLVNDRLCHVYVINARFQARQKATLCNKYRKVL